MTFRAPRKSGRDTRPSDVSADIDLPVRWTLLRPHPEQSRLWNSPARFKLAPAGRGSGKTELAKRRVVMALAEHVPGNTSPMYFVGGPTEEQVKRIWWDDLKALVPAAWIAGISEGELTIDSIFGSRIVLASLLRPIRIEGNQYAGGVVDESCDIIPGTWARSIRPALSQWTGWAWRIGVPKRHGVGVGEFRRAYEDACSGQWADADGFWWDSASVMPAEEVAAAKAELSGEDFREQYGAQWLATAGLLFGTYSDENIVACAYDPARPVGVGCTFGRSPLAWTVCQRIDSKLCFIGEIFLREGDTRRGLDELHRLYPSHRAGWTFAGPAPGHGATFADYATIRRDRRFVGVQLVPGLPDSADNQTTPADRVTNLTRLLADNDGRRHVAIDPACLHLIADLRLRSEIDPAGDLGWPSDAAGAIAWSASPLRMERHPAARTLRRIIA